MDTVMNLDRELTFTTKGDNFCDIDLTAIRDFMQRFRCEDRIFIPSKYLNELQVLFEAKAKLLLDISPLNPLSTMETVVLALSFNLSTKHIACVLMSTSGTVDTYIKRARFKLGAKSKISALYQVIKKSYIQIL